MALVSSEQDKTSTHGRVDLLLAVTVWGLLLFPARSALATETIPAAGPPNPAVSLYDFRCRNDQKENEGRLSLRIGLRHFPAVSADGHLAVAAHELVADDMSDHPRHVVKVSPDVEWRSNDRVVVYFVDLDTNRAAAPIGVLPSPIYFSQYRSCSRAKRILDGIITKLTDRLTERPWAPLFPLATNLREPYRRDQAHHTTQKRAIGDATIEFRFPNLTIRHGKADEGGKTHKVAMTTYPSHSGEDVFGELELEPASFRTWLTDLWIEPTHGILVMRLMNYQTSDAVLGNAFTYFLQVSPLEAKALCPGCAAPGSAR